MAWNELSPGCNNVKLEEENQNIMKQGITRSIIRWTHIVISIPILGYIYNPFEELPNYAPAVRFVFLPTMVLSGLWMWKGHALRQLISKGSASRHAGSETT